MGYYIPNNRTLETQAAIFLAKIQPTIMPKSLKDVPEGEALICQVDNGFFKANALIYSERELKDFSDNSDERPRKWFFMTKNIAHQLSDYSE